MMTPRRALIAIALLSLLGPAPPAHAAREFSRGNITAVDWRVMQIEIKTPQGGRLTYKVAPDCSVKFTDKTSDFPNPKLQDLTPPMYIHFVFENQTMLEIDVREVGFDVTASRAQSSDRPSSDRPSSDRQSSDRQSSDRQSSDRQSSDRQYSDRQYSDRQYSDRPYSERPRTVRIVRVDERRGTFDADVAGRRQAFRVETSRLLRGLGQGDLVVLTVEHRGGSDVVTAIRVVAQSGRVTQVDERRGELIVEVRGRETFYQVESPELLRRIRVGDRVTYVVDDRRGRRVITSIE
jgi:Cu/Ag efflux protein CusF